MVETVWATAFSPGPSMNLHITGNGPGLRGPAPQCPGSCRWHTPFPFVWQFPCSEVQHAYCVWVSHSAQPQGFFFLAQGIYLLCQAREITVRSQGWGSGGLSDPRSSANSDNSFLLKMAPG